MKRYRIEIPLALLGHLDMPPSQKAELRLTEEELDALQATAELMTDLYTPRGDYSVNRAAHHLLARIERARTPHTTACGDSPPSDETTH